MYSCFGNLSIVLNHDIVFVINENKSCCCFQKPEKQIFVKYRYRQYVLHFLHVIQHIKRLFLDVPVKRQRSMKAWKFLFPCASLTSKHVYSRRPATQLRYLFFLNNQLLFFFVTLLYLQ